MAKKGFSSLRRPAVVPGKPMDRFAQTARICPSRMQGKRIKKLFPQILMCLRGLFIAPTLNDML